MDIRLTKDLLYSWVFQDAEKLKWWIDLQLLADDNLEINMSIRDLANRWKAPRSSVQRFIKRLCAEPICGTKMGHQMGQQMGHLIICELDGCEDAWDTKWDTKWDKNGTDTKKGLSSPYNPLLSKENYNQSLNSAHAREEKLPWDENKERSFKAQFQAEGRIIASARKTGCDAIGINDYLERFMAHCQSVDFGHANIGHFGAHFNKFVEQEKAKPLQTSRSSQSTLDWNSQIAKELGLMK